MPQARFLSTAEGSGSAVAEPDPQDADMAPPMSASASMLLQSCAEAFRSFEVRNREQHPRSAVSFSFMDDELISACCDGEHIFGVMRLDPDTNSVMVRHRDPESEASFESTLDSFAEKAATCLLRARRFRARRQ